MLQITDGQCGKCVHFGESKPNDEQIVQIRIRGVAPEGLTEECGHPANAKLHLQVAPNSGCDGYQPARVA